MLSFLLVFAFLFRAGLAKVNSLQWTKNNELLKWKCLLLCKHQNIHFLCWTLEPRDGISNVLAIRLSPPSSSFSNASSLLFQFEFFFFFSFSVIYIFQVNEWCCPGALLWWMRLPQNWTYFAKRDGADRIKLKSNSLRVRVLNHLKILRHFCSLVAT